MMTKTLGLLFITLILLTPCLQAQKKKINEPGTYYSIKDALKVDPLSVKKLYLSKQRLKAFPDVIFNFPNLNQLDLSRNKIKEIPENIADLRHLTYLNVSKNKITQLPEGIGKMRTLRSFKFSQNRITSLPSGFFKISTLEIVELFSNPLDINPERFAVFKNQLKFIDIRNTSTSRENCELLFTILNNTRIKCDKKCKCHNN
jgi:Leucine-rich repeat (LRR) protein